MDDDRTQHETRDLLEAYALGALDEDERLRVEAHLETCPACRALAGELAETAHSLPLALGAASPLRPPAALKGRVLQAVGTPAVPRPTRRGRWWRPRIAIALGALAVVVGFAAWTAHLSAALSDERSARERLAVLVGRQEVVLEVVDSRKTSRAVLSPPEGTPSRAYGKVFTRSDLRAVVAMAGRLPKPPAGQEYRLWLESGGSLRAVGTMSVNQMGFALLVLQAPRRGPVYEEALVILQRAGSVRPVGRTVLVWRR
jgi:anti-sigma-K factor RskA